MFKPTSAFVALVAEHLRHRLVRPDDAAGRIDERHADAGVVERVAEHLLRLAEGGVRLLAFGDVAQVRDPALDARVVEEVGER